MLHVPIKHLKHDNAFIPKQIRIRLYNAPTCHQLCSDVYNHHHGNAPKAATTLARDGNIEQVRTIVAMITNDAEQAAYFWRVLEKEPSAQPISTTSVAPFFLSALDTFTIPGSCPFPASSINIATFSPFDLVGIGMIKHKDQNLTFETGLNGVASVVRYFNMTDGCRLYVTHLTAQLAPISMPATNLWWNKIVVDAYFPYCKYSMDRLSLAALATKDDFSSVDEML